VRSDTCLSIYIAPELKTSAILIKLELLENAEENVIKMNLREIGWDGVDWIDMAQDRDLWRALVNTVLNLRVP
jgi:phage-related protein